LPQTVNGVTLDTTTTTTTTTTSSGSSSSSSSSEEEAAPDISLEEEWQQAEQVSTAPASCPRGYLEQLLYWA
jgi:hypothetical protein